MKRSFSFSFVSMFLCLSYAAFAAPVRSETFELTDGQELNQKIFLNDPSIFSIENARGLVRVNATNGNTIEVSVIYKGKKPSKLNFVEVEKGKIKIFIQYPEGTASGGRRGGVSIGNSININGVSFGSVSGRNISVINNRVYINGKEVKPESGSTATDGNECAELEISIPKALLVHLKAESGQGLVDVKGFSDINDATSSRFILLKSEQGAITFRDLKAPSGITVKTCQGRVCATDNQANLELKTEQGSIQVIANDGYVYAKTEQGSVQVSNINGRVELRSEQGSINANGGTGDILAKTEMGNVQVSAQKGRVAAKTEMGSIILNNPQSTSEYAKTSMGRVSGLRENIRCRDSLEGIHRREKIEDKIFDF